MTLSHAIIGVDGGGSSTKAMAIDSAGQLIGDGVSGPSNPNNSDFESAAQAIDLAISQALAEKDVPIASICLGIAGVASESQRSELSAALYHRRPKLLDSKLHLTHDLEIAHCNLFQGGAGILLIAGTGSAAFAIDARGNAHRVSGRDYRFEDPGSGYAIGKRALDDGLFPDSDIDGRSSVAALAPKVIERASQGDLKALNVVRIESEHLIRMMVPLLREIDFKTRPLPLGLAGGLVEADSIYRSNVLYELKTLLGIGEARFPKTPSSHGALRLAWRLLNGDEPFPEPVAAAKP
ncbi:BadF/BadG/BcrA/BcrD ATPase family protein [Pelagicoccus sp. SDUM812003]|uniref:N-acetylglucosamine kinase n=1 Tax=Pelagicoccus sp. SDUM812003 TaxID=3041267 RepID=UPI00280D24D4|nr:BadF/BadG/BcrA/BcrD ATPase family protein [Pelagicoccus sp. SDUM812003]MDQ8202343.1 BadF/BadG/BcrA/BcrD ATPase family protein [Pelagicoccus sp. SDUM812003]